MKYIQIKDIPFIPVGTIWTTKLYGKFEDSLGCFYPEMMDSDTSYTKSEMKSLVRQGYFKEVK